MTDRKISQANRAKSSGALVVALPRNLGYDGASSTPDLLKRQGSALST